MHVRFVSPAGVELYDAAELPTLLARADGLVWVDVPVWDEQAEQTLSSIFGFHPLAIRDSAHRNQVPKIHRYDDHLFLVLHAPQPGAGGHVHYVELDQFIGDRYLVTVHGPLNPAVDPAAAMVEVDTVLARLASGKLKPDKGFELSYALLTALTGRLRTYTAELTKDVWMLEQRVTGDHLGDPESFLDEMFRARHGLLTVSTMSALSREVYSRMATITACGLGSRAIAATGRCRSVPPSIGDGGDPEVISSGNDRVLPGAHQHEDDHRGRTARGDRCCHAADHGAVLRSGHEPDRQR